MKIELTGVSQETTLAHPDEVSINLVFNHGDLRIPVGEEALQAVLEYIAATESSEQAPSEYPNGAEVFGTEGTPQQEVGDFQTLQPYEEPEEDSIYNEDINDGVGQV